MSTGAPARPVVFAYERHDPRDASLDWLRARGVEVRTGLFNSDPSHRRYDEATMIRLAADCDALLGSSSAQISARVLDALPRLRCISKIGIGVDSIDVGAATARGVLVSNTPEQGGVDNVAEHAIALMLGLLKRLHAWTPEYLRRGGWRGAEHAGTIAGSTVGIIGFGRIGRAVAARLAAWNARIVAYDPFLVPPVPGVEMLALPALLATADVVTLHCGADASNHHMIDAAALAAMKPGALLVNTGRGTLVDTAALVDALRSGRLGGAALDVFEREPPDAADPLLALPNVLTTPHVAAWTLDVYLGRRVLAAANVLQMLRGEPCPHVVNPQARR